MGVEEFASAYLTPLWKAGLVSDVTPGDRPPTAAARKLYAVGPRWEAVLPYVWRVREARGAGRTMDDLEREGWLHREDLGLR